MFSEYSEHRGRPPVFFKKKMQGVGQRSWSEREGSLGKELGRMEAGKLWSECMREESFKNEKEKECL